MNPSSPQRRLARIATAAASCIVLLTTGYGWSVYHELSANLTTSDALSDTTSTNADATATNNSSNPTNILIMGLDSRRDQNGNPLPQEVLDQLHAGDSDNGGYNTNVLMLVHLPGGQSGQPTAISIPRDDYTILPGRPSGETKAKIKEGYGLAKAEAEHRLRTQGITDPLTLERQGREAGRKQTIKTVQEFLGVHIDHFVEVTLVGFYDLAQALGQITVCLQGPTQDSYSGARFISGTQQLDAAQALAFVRQRRDYVHPELNFTDLDRARRQQAFLASAAYQLKSAGTLTNPARLQDLIHVAAKDIVIDKGFDLLQFDERAPSLMNGGLSFTTLPVKAFGTVGGQAVNLVDPNEIRRVVHSVLTPDDAAATDPPPTQLPAATLDIANGTGRTGLAATLATSLTARGLTPGRLTTDRKADPRTHLTYSLDVRDAAAALADLLSTPGTQPDPHLKAGHLRLQLGTDFTTPAELNEPPEPGGVPNPPPGATASAGGVAASSLHTDGIPCVK
jgi:LCP family protein required for cell wall assembly